MPRGTSSAPRLSHITIGQLPLGSLPVTAEGAYHAAGSGVGDRGLGTVRKRYTIDGRAVTKRDLREIRTAIEELVVIEAISDEMRTIVESEWPDLVLKLPPKGPPH